MVIVFSVKLCFVDFATKILQKIKKKKAERYLTTAYFILDICEHCAMIA